MLTIRFTQFALTCRIRLRRRCLRDGSRPGCEGGIADMRSLDFAIKIHPGHWKTWNVRLWQRFCGTIRRFVRYRGRRQGWRSVLAFLHIRIGVLLVPSPWNNVLTVPDPVVAAGSPPHEQPETGQEYNESSHTNTNADPYSDVLMMIVLLLFGGSTGLSLLLYLGTCFRTRDQTSAVHVLRSLG